MQKSAFVCLLMFSGSLTFGQLDSNSITVSVSRSSSVQPDQVVFGIVVRSGLSTGLEDVVAALQGSGITSANFSGVSTSYSNTNQPSMLAWTFTLAVPFAKQKDTVTSLTDLEQTVAQAGNGLTLSFSLVGTQVSTQLLQSHTCSLSSLFADAQAQAQNVASAAGVTLGSILALSSATSNVASTTPAFIGLSGILASSFTSTVNALPCAMTVKFSLLRFQ